MSEGPETGSGDDPMIVSVAVQFGPLWRRDQPGKAFRGDLHLFAEQMTSYLARNLEQFADSRSADLYVGLSVKRGEETAGHEYRSGHYVTAQPDGSPHAPDPSSDPSWRP